MNRRRTTTLLITIALTPATALAATIAVRPWNGQYSYTQCYPSPEAARTHTFRSDLSPIGTPSQLTHTILGCRHGDYHTILNRPPNRLSAVDKLLERNSIERILGSAAAGLTALGFAYLLYLTIINTLEKLGVNARHRANKQPATAG